ncbi:MAG TPA: hypothetical protein VGE34_04205 [Candidatus Saccharimonadales bacterium]
MSRREDSKRMFIIVGSIFTGVGVSVAAVVIMFFAVLNPPSPKQSREDLLSEFMPSPPKEARFVKEGYEPKSHCFDKCGYLYRVYSYTSHKALCRNLFDALKNVGHRSSVVDGSNRDMTQEQCEEFLAKYVQKKSMTSSLRLDVRARMKSKNDRYHYTNESIVASVIVSLSEKTIEYQVSQLNEDKTFTY